MKPALLLLAIFSALLLLLPPNSVVAKSATVGIYAIIDQVAFEPTGSLPNFLRISGVFVVPVSFIAVEMSRSQSSSGVTISLTIGGRDWMMRIL